MANNGFYRNVNCYFTSEGRTTFAKQNNGIKFSKLGAVIFSDKNHSLINAIKSDNIELIENITLKQLNNYTQLIFGNISYTYIGGTFTPVSSEAVDEAIKNPTKCLPVDISYERESDEDYFSYNFTLTTSAVNIEANENDDFNFDGFALLGIPYKSTNVEHTQEFIEKQTPTILAIIYFEDDGEKLQILHNQPDVAAMSVEIHITLEDEICLDSISEYVDSNGNGVENNIATRNLVGLRQVNDGLTNRDSTTDGEGTDANVFISNMDTDTTTAYDSYAKLNIMTEATNDLTAAVPQIMLAQTTSGNYEKTWNGDRLEINYASGNDGGYFRISEITGGYRNDTNVELFGYSNVYHTSVTGDYGNNFIYSRLNTLTDDNTNISFIHSDFNTFENKDMNNISFINSNHNYIRSTTGEGEDQTASARYISFYNSNNNVIHPRYDIIHNTDNNTYSYKKGLISKSTIINSNYNYIKGRSTVPYKTGYDEPNSTFINTMSSFYNLNAGRTLTMIGSTFSFINDTNGNIIGIGDGLIQNNGSGDRIILGHYNRNSTDPNEVLIVGDGRMKSSYIKGLLDGIKNWNTKLNSYTMLLSNVSGDGSTAHDSNYYRHNIFTVNKEGYVTISDYNTNQSARYGFSGISAFDNKGKCTYDIPFESIYKSLNKSKTQDENNEDLKLYEKAINDILKETPKTYYQPIANKNNSTENTPFSAYINPRTQIQTSVNSDVINITNLDSNTVCNFTYYPVKNYNTPLCLIWYIRYPGDHDFTEKHAVVEPFTCKKLITVTDDVETSTSLSGFTEIS